MKDDPDEIARSLIQQHGREQAMREAMHQGYEAQADGRLYDLSIWREVKKFLRELRDARLADFRYWG